MNANWEMSLEPLFGSYWPLLSFLLVALLLQWLLVDDRPLTRGQRQILLGLRMLGIGMLLFAFLRPGLTMTRKSAPQGALAVLVDTSESMNLAADTSFDTRWDVERKLWQQIQDNAHRLDRDTMLSLYSYADSLQGLGTVGAGSAKGSEQPEVSLPLAADGLATDVGKSLSQLISQQVEPPLSAVIWMGDGTQTVSPSSVDPQQIVKQWTQLDIPLYMIGIGPRADAGKLRDVAIEGLPEQLSVFSSNQTAVTALVQAKGFIHRELPISLWLRDANGKEELIANDRIVPEQNDQTIPIRFNMIAPAAGIYELHVRTPVIEGELVAENNQALCYLNVRKGGVRVLYLEGEPRYEQMGIRRSLDSSRDFQIDFQLIYPPEFPKDLRPQLKPGDYDAIIIGNLDALALSDETHQMIADQVEGGCGILFLGGYFSYGPGGYAGKPLGSVMPMELDGRMRQRPREPLLKAMHYEEQIPLQPSSGTHPITTLGDNNPTIWESLSPMQGANRLGKIRNGPGVQVLLEGPNAEPMMVLGEYGKGKVLCLAFDSTWRWRLQGQGDLHKQFWRQAILYCLKSEPTEENLAIEMDKRRLYRNQSSEVSVVWTPGLKTVPIPSDTTLRLVADRRDLGTVGLEKRDDRTLVGRLMAPKEPGAYRLIATGTGSDGQTVTSQMPFLVLDQSVESMQPMPDWSLLSQLAALNAPAGGMLVAPEDLEKIFQSMSSRQRKAAIETVTSYRLGDGSVDSWLMLLLFVGIWGTQWWLRKRWNLA